MTYIILVMLLISSLQAIMWGGLVIASRWEIRLIGLAAWIPFALFCWLTWRYVL